MGKAEAGSTKAIGNAIKAKGLGRLRWYCQVCEKQCRDENGFQAHCRSEPHMRKIIAVGPKAGQTIAEFSRQFQYEFISLLRTRHSTKRVQANKVYNEYIQDKHHVHMNATRWVTLSGFVQTLGKAGIIKVDEDEKGIWISWIDNSPSTLAKQAASQRRDRAEMDGEERERKLLEDQIARAKAQSDAAELEQQSAGLQKKDGEKISLSFNFNPAGPSRPTSAAPGPIASETPVTDIKPSVEAGPSTTPASAAAETTSVPVAAAPTSISFGSFGTMPSPAAPVGNPLKRPAPMNIFKTAKVAKTATGAGDDAKSEVSAKTDRGRGFTSEVERLMKEDQARKSAKAAQGSGGGGYGGFGPRRDAVRR